MAITLSIYFVDFCKSGKDGLRQVFALRVNKNFVESVLEKLRLCTSIRDLIKVLINVGNVEFTSPYRR